MSLWRQLTRAFAHSHTGRRPIGILPDEVQDYLAQATTALEESGLSSGDARRAAHLEFGNPTVIREQVRSYGWECLFGMLGADLHYAARQLLHNPGFALVSILTLALGIGASRPSSVIWRWWAISRRPFPRCSPTLRRERTGDQTDSSRIPGRHAERTGLQRRDAFSDTGTACIWLARHVKGGTNRRIFGSFSWASMANAAPNTFRAQLAFPGRQTIALCGDGGFTMLGLGDLLTQVQRKTPVVQVILDNESLDFVNIEMQEAGVVPFGVDFQNPNVAKVAEAMGAKGIRIEEPGDVREGLAVALAHKGGPGWWMRWSIPTRCRCQ